MSKKVKRYFAIGKINWSFATEVVGLTLFTIGAAMVFLPAAFIVLGAFLVFVTEKNN